MLVPITRGASGASAEMVVPITRGASGASAETVVTITRGASGASAMASSHGAQTTRGGNPEQNVPTSASRGVLVNHT